MAPYEYNATVDRVIDADTIKVDVDLGFSIWAHDLSVRLLGLNAREHNDPGGQAAISYLRGLLPAGTPVRVRTVKPDKYGGRWLASVELVGGYDLAAHLIAEQWAAPWDGSGPKPVPPWPRTLDPGRSAP